MIDEKRDVCGNTINWSKIFKPVSKIKTLDWMMKMWFMVWKMWNVDEKVEKIRKKPNLKVHDHNSL